LTSYSLTFARSARKELQALDRDIADRILEAIEALILQPRPPGCKKLRGGGALWRIRVSDYRVVYGIDDDEKVVDIVVIRHRSDVYR
jgi:mRNA interferase RelE/StbE